MTFTLFCKTYEALLLTFQTKLILCLIVLVVLIILPQIHLFVEGFVGVLLVLDRHGRKLSLEIVTNSDG